MALRGIPPLPEPPDLPIILHTGAWEGGDAGREVPERKADAVVVFKEVRDREREDRAARVRTLPALSVALCPDARSIRASAKGWKTVPLLPCREPSLAAQSASPPRSS